MSEPVPQAATQEAQPPEQPGASIIPPPGWTAQRTAELGALTAN
jgi:hypothetical protein